MNHLRRISAMALVLTLAIAGVFSLRHNPGPVIKRVYAQVGPAAPVGYVAAVNNLVPASSTGLAGAVTNVSTFLMAISGGNIYCNGNISNIGQSQMFLAANTTYLIVYNCPQELLYAKTAVTGPGTSGTSVGVPTSLLYATAGVEIPLANVVCGASNCATITDSRPLTAFPQTVSLAGHVGVPAINGDFAFTVTMASGTVTKVFTTPYNTAYGCNASYTGSGTLTTGAKVTVNNSSLSQVVVSSSTGTDTAVMFVNCFGLPN